ncbi:AAA family ATPase [Anaeromicrobium sediminis]|uniref:Bacterial transcriptional activator domain-containing protein n=1 Tax=Anaeromicrobium sediminis TaxID=1478221 RepID=A0A267MIN7_9FIRM|nr:AAA family ATPase [Anaeromicrobium sediminis]PAB59317.1 hypothetical protein CCE28_10665 [Anaeromicrobium sediminis]
MVKIVAKLFGTPEIFYEENRISFPFRKAEALFYYLLVKKRAKRNELVNLLWCEANESTGKKNLRNAVYTIRKLFKDDIIISPSRSILMLNEDIDWHIDVENFLKDNIENNIEYEGEFLQGFLIKDAENFQEWMIGKKEEYKDKLIDRLNKKIDMDFKNKLYEEAESNCKRLIKIDELDEKAYRFLMGVYDQVENYNKGIEVYNKLVNILDKELAITPDVKTTELFEELIQKKAMKNKEDTEKSRSFLFGREKELKKLKKNFNNFIRDKEYKNMVLTGEEGIGKTKLAEEFMDKCIKDDSYKFISRCYEVEKHYLLKPWSQIFNQLGNIIKEDNIKIPVLWENVISYIFPGISIKDNIKHVNLIENVDILKYQVAEEIIINILKTISRNKKIVLFFDDIQWIDKSSLSLIKNIMQKNSDIFFVFTYRSYNKQELELFLSKMIKNNILDEIPIKRFSREDVFKFSKVYLGKNIITKELNHILYKETEGNTFFLVEILNNIRENKSLTDISDKTKNILRHRLLSISEESRKILNIFSIFFDKITLRDIISLSGKKELELMDIIEELQEKNIIKERITGDEIEFVFTHKKIRDYVYNQMSLSRKKLLHNKVANYIEGQMAYEDDSYYGRLIYHFNKSGNKLKELEYIVKNFKTYLQLTQEVFPLVSPKLIGKYDSKEVNKGEVIKKLEEIKNIIKELKKSGKGETLRVIELHYLNMLGKYYIATGDYKRGINITEKIIHKALEIKEYLLALEGYQQLIYYCMNTSNINMMEEYINKAFEIISKENYMDKKGVFLRFKGYLNILKGEYESAEELLKSSINILTTLDENNKYILNIAAAYHYMGDAKRINNQNEDAIIFYKRAVILCESKNIIVGLPTVYTNIGQAYYNMKDYKKSKEYIKKALSIYSKLNYLWGRSIAHGYMALLLIEEENYNLASLHLKKSKEVAEKIKNPNAMKVYEEVKDKMANRNKK